jgi:hypothetical protein
VLGAPKSPDGSAGLVLRDGAGVTVSNNRIDGGAAEIVSYGMIIDERASPHVFHNEIDGGTGAVSGSIGLLVSSPDAGSPCIEENVIGGGAGMAETAASQGLVILDANLKDAPGCPVRGNTIDGGSGTAKEGAHSVGVHVTGSSVVDLVDNAIDGGSGTGEISGPVGVFIAGSASVHVDSNRVFAGRHSMAGGAYAVIANAGTSVVITNNFISGGRAEGEGIKGAVGILLSGCTSASVQHNTVFGGLPQDPATQGSTGIYLAGALNGALIENNIFIGTFGTASYGILSEVCPSLGPIRNLRNNVFAGFAQGALFYAAAVDVPVDTPCVPNQMFNPEISLESELSMKCGAATPGKCMDFGGVLASGNRSVRAACIGLPGSCIQIPTCTNLATCADALWAGWTAEDAGVTELFGSGWLWDEASPCAATEGGLDLGIAVDSFGAPRTRPPSIGAHEYDGPCGG